MTVSAVGHETKVIPGVVVTAGPAAALDVQLGPEPVQLEPYGFDLQDGGNGDFDPGETSTLAVTLENLGKAATHVNAELIPTGWYGTVMQPMSSYPDIATGMAEQSDAPHHQVALDAGTPVGHRAGYALQWATDQGVGQSEAFFIDTGSLKNSNEASTDVPQMIPNLPAPAFISSDVSYPLQLEIVAVLG